MSAIPRLRDDFLYDLRYGLRQLLRYPFVSAVCILTLSLGIGANAAIFSAVHAVLLRPLPFKDPDRLVLVNEYNPGNVAKTGSPYVRYQARAEQNTVFEETAGYWDVSGGDGIIFGGNGSAERLRFSIVTNSFFPVLGVQSVLGRTFIPSEAVPGASAKVFLASNSLWRRELGGRPPVLGQTYLLDGKPHTLVGVLPAGFSFPGNTDIWIPVGTLGRRLPEDRKAAQRTAFLRELLQRLNSAPGVRIAAATDCLPLSCEGNWGGINVVGRPLLDSAHAPAVEGRGVSANYFRALGIPLLRGREFTEEEVAEGRHVTVINQTMANQFFPGGDPVGQQLITPYDPEKIIEIVGVVGDVKDFALDAQSPPEMYTPYNWWSTMNLVLRGSADAASLVATVRTQVATLDKQVPVYEVTHVRELVSHSVARQRFELFLLVLFASLAMALAAVGIYGLLAFTVNRRTHEIGIRMAIGAHPRSLLALILGQGMKLVLIGLTAGIVSSLMLMRLMGSLLFHVHPFDPLSLAAATFLLAGIAALACFLPARRAMRVDPAVALRSE